LTRRTAACLAFDDAGGIMRRVFDGWIGFMSGVRLCQEMVTPLNCVPSTATTRDGAARSPPTAPLSLKDAGYLYTGFLGSGYYLFVYDVEIY
jgi:hypothetical protein